jgi:DNA-binding NarL/FixJ family response regulator
MKKVLIADDHQIFLAGLRMIFADNKDFFIAKEVNNGQEVLDAFRKEVFDFAILDINMPIFNGIVVCKKLAEKYPTCKVIFLTMYSDLKFVNEFAKSNAYGYVLKNAGKAELLKALVYANKGEKYISSELKYTTHWAELDSSKYQALTKREMEIIGLLAKGKSSQQIAEDLCLSVFTVNTHRKNILHKLQLKNAAGIVKFALENNMI